MTCPAQENGVSLVLGRAILDRLGTEGVLRLSNRLKQSAGSHREFSIESLSHELRMADQNEALRLIASAYLENIVGPDRGYHFIVRSEGGEHVVSNATEAFRFRTDLRPQELVRIFFVEVGRSETELPGADGVLTVLAKHAECVDPESRKTALEKLQRASYESVRNEAMALAFMKIWHRETCEVVGGFVDIFDYLESIDGYVFFNRLSAFAARSLTPFSKMRLTLSAEEVLNFAPEFCKEVSIRFAAVIRSKMKLSFAGRYKDFDQAVSELYPDVLATWSAELTSRNLNPADYVLFPFHPLNGNWLEQHTRLCFQENEFIHLSGVLAGSVPSLSFRSMLLHNQCLKLPVPIQTTHLSRNIPVAEIKNGPLFSDFFHGVIESEGLQEKLELERDLMGAYLDFEGIGCDEDNATMVNFIVRQNPAAQIHESEHVIPVSAIFLFTPTQKVPFFLSIMDKVGVRTEDEQYEYFAAYSNLVISTQLELYFKTGVMLEAHQQNLNLVYDKTWSLKRLMYHDIPGGMSGFVPLLRARYEIPEGMLHKIYKFKNTPDRSILQFVHPTLTSHLLPLANTLCYCLGLDKRRLRDIIRREIETQIGAGRRISAATQEEAVARKELIDKFEEKVLSSRTLPAKGMLTMFFRQAGMENWGTKFPNTPADLISGMGFEMENFLVV